MRRRKALLHTRHRSPAPPAWLPWRPPPWTASRKTSCSASLWGEGSGDVALLAAIFAANFPEALVGSASMRAHGRSQRFILGTWTVCAVLLVSAVVLGAGPLSRASAESLSLPLAFAAGAVLAALADAHAGGL